MTDTIQVVYNLTMKANQVNINKGEKMTKYKTKFQYVSWNENNAQSIKKAETKKAKLENQGYFLKHTNCSPFSALLCYENANYKSKYKQKGA